MQVALVRYSQQTVNLRIAIDAKELSKNNFPISRSNVVHIQGAARGA